MEAGRKLIECLIVYCRINIAESIKSIKEKKKKDKKEKDAGEEEAEQEDQDKQYEMFNAKDLEKEL
jgi:hypothetical protein